jgi:triosephosphate isomerase
VLVAESIAGRSVDVGAQNCWTETSGAFTGEVSPAMLAGLCRFVIVGHSERRTLIGESDDLVRAKTSAVLAAGMSPIVCVGEALETRAGGDAEAFVHQQIARALGGRPGEEIARCVVAYEPIWAIGTGIAATAADAEEMASAIRATLREAAHQFADEIRILYGGSVSAANAAEILSGPNVDGALVGGASLNAESFLAIAEALAH